MAHPTDWSVEELRSPHEPKHHWGLKKAFVERHKADIPRDRLMCLAQTLANIEFMGCWYPPETMEQVKELSRGLVEEVREARRGKLQRTLVPGSEAASCKVNRTSMKRPAGQEEGPIKKQTPHKYGNFVAASSTSADQGEQKNLEGFILPPKRTQGPAKGPVEPSRDFMSFCNNVIGRNKPKEVGGFAGNRTDHVGFGWNQQQQNSQGGEFLRVIENCSISETEGDGDENTDLEIDLEEQKSAEEKLKERLRAKLNVSKVEEVEPRKIKEAPVTVEKHKYGNFVASSSGDDSVQDVTVEPSNDFMSFCNNVIGQADVEEQKSAEERLKERLRAKLEGNNVQQRRSPNVKAREEVQNKAHNQTNKNGGSMQRNNLFSQAMQGFNGGTPEPTDYQPAEYKANYQRHFEAERGREEERLRGHVEERGDELVLDYSYPLHQFLVVTLAYMPDEHPCGLLNR